MKKNLTDPTKTRTGKPRKQPYTVSEKSIAHCTEASRQRSAEIAAAKQEPEVLATANMIPILPEEHEFNRMTLDQIADHINSLDEGTQKVRKITAMAIAIQSIARGVNKSDCNDMRRRFYAYCALAERCGLKIGNLNAYASMGISMDVARQWRIGGFGSNPERKKLLEEVSAVCAGTREMMASDGQVNPVLAIFWGKNYDGLRDVQEHVVAPGDPLGDRQTPEQIKEKYADIIEG